jgi:hypothetical protein
MPLHEQLGDRQRKNVLKGRRMAHAFSLRPLIVEGRASACGICKRRSGNGTVFLRVLQFSPVNIIPPFFCAPSLSYHRPHMILATDSVVK